MLAALLAAPRPTESARDHTTTPVIVFCGVPDPGELFVRRVTHS